MTTKTKIIFLFIVGLATVVVVALLSLEKTQVYTLPTRGGVNVTITVAAAPQLEAWAREAALDFSGRNSQITVKVIAMKGIDASQQLDLSKTDGLPDAWIAEADFVRQMARSVPFDETGPSMAQDGLIWLAVAARTGLQGQLNWQTIHVAATDSTQWQTLGAGDARFDAALPSPANSIEGVAAFLSAAAGYYQQPALSVDTVGNRDFVQWMDDILIAVPEKKLDPLNQLTRPPVSVDVGMVLQSDLPSLNAGQFIQQPPQYNVVFNFPYLVRRGNLEKDAADREQAAEIFRDFLLSADQQNRLVGYGLQPAGTAVGGVSVSVDGATAERLRTQFK